MNVPNANPPAAVNIPQLPNLPREILRQILRQNEVWQGQKGVNRHHNTLSPVLTREYMMSRATLREPLPWKPTAADRRAARLNAQNRRAALRRIHIGASPLDFALVSEEPEAPVDIVRPRRKDMLVFDDLKSMAKWFSAENGHPRVLREHPNINADVLNPQEDQRIPWICSVRFVQVTFIDYAQYSAQDQPNTMESEYAHDAFRELANAMGRMALERLHIIVPFHARVFMTIDDPGVWAITHIRGLIGFDIQSRARSVNNNVVRQLKAICEGQRTRWLPTGMAYQLIWRPPPNMCRRPPNSRFDWRQHLRASRRKTLLQVQHDWLNEEYRRLFDLREQWKQTSKLKKRQQLRRLRRAWANLDAYVIHGQNAPTAHGAAEFAVEMQRLQNQQTQSLNDYTVEDNALTALRAAPAPAAFIARRQLGVQKTTAMAKRRTAQRALIEVNRVLTHYTQNGFNVWPRVIKLRKAKDDAQLEYQYARKERRAIRRGKDGEVVRNIRRAANGYHDPYPRTHPGRLAGNGQAAGLRDEAGDLLTRQLRDVSPNESMIDADPDYR